MESIEQLKKAFYAELAPPPELTISEWADKYRVLTSEASNEPGPWRTSRFPFTEEIMYELSPQCKTQEVVWMSGAQNAKTEICLNLMGYTIHYNPQPLLYIQKTVDAVERFSAQRFQKSLCTTPEIAERLPQNKSRDDSNTKLLKNFPGGIIILGGANSGASLRSMPIGVLITDEVDSFKAGIEDEGDPIELAKRRTSNFPRRKIFYPSTPKVKETSRIEPLYEISDQRTYHVPCPHCGHMQTIRWGNIQYKTKDGGNHELLDGSVYLKCEGCAEAIQEYHKTEMLENGEWIKKYPGRKIAGFHSNSLYSPVGFYSWEDAVELWLQYRRTLNTEFLRVFVNTVLGETYAEGTAIKSDVISSRKEIYPADVPAGGVVLTAGVDVQADRIEAEILATGKGEENFSIAYARFMGDPEFSYVWKQLDDFLLKQWKHESGVYLTPVCVAVDSGYKAKVVYNFCKTREERRIFPIKGVSGWGKGLINRPKTRNKNGVWLFNTYADELKAKIYSQLRVENPGPAYCHFPQKPEYDRNYFKMLTAEKLVKKKNTIKWTLPAGQPNEALDCRQYAIAALNILSPNFEKLESSGGPLVVQNRKIKKKRKRILSKGMT